MVDYPIQQTQDPHCIMAVYPDEGGSWVAPLRPNAARNFASRPMTWHGAMEGFNEKFVNGHTCSLELSAVFDSLDRGIAVFGNKFTSDAFAIYTASGYDIS